MKMTISIEEDSAGNLAVVFKKMKERMNMNGFTLKVNESREVGKLQREEARVRARGSQC